MNVQVKPTREDLDILSSPLWKSMRSGANHTSFIKNKSKWIHL